ncbi:hypothetical protein [Streptomyces sp. NEAU-YJ-81]|uniref:hypothetical protein n=1 Tax=Streptomyces sp. NEAU-YJ-81 TaxID=2820288 RepID=UPI001ABD3D87|nr:hypothetical protein [Streptomyces sp. NEAU-YJ-81]MBO3681664.1 hypothetical protein [Streptomyces sp. NEAU-YJ-81]
MTSGFASDGRPAVCLRVTRDGNVMTSAECWRGAVTVPLARGTAAERKPSESGAGGGFQAARCSDAPPGSAVACLRSARELGVFLEVEAPGGGHDPAILREEHAQRFVADQRHREREGLPSLAVKRPDGSASIVATVTRSVVFNAVRKLMRDALDTDTAEVLCLEREFISAFPTAGATIGRTARRPFLDEVARALADETNLAELASTYDINDNGVRDIWETTVTTGRRIGEVIKLRWDCIGRYGGGLAMFWHDQTKVGNYDAAIRIPERLYKILAERQRETLDRFIARYGYRPTGAQRAGLCGCR